MVKFENFREQEIWLSILNSFVHGGSVKNYNSLIEVAAIEADKGLEAFKERVAAIEADKGLKAKSEINGFS